MGAESALGRIEDDAQYRAAIATLDRLFARDKRRTPGELAYFRWLAGRARDYEAAPARRPRRRGPSGAGMAGHLRASGRN